MSWHTLAQFPSAPTPFARNSQRLWIGVIVVLLVTGIAIPLSGLSIDLKSNPMLLVASSLYSVAIWFYSFIRRDERLVQPLITVAQLFLVLLTGLLLSYAVTTLAPPYRDAQLLAIDQWLGFDRPSYVDLLTNRPWKVRVCDLVYLSMLPQVAVVPFALIFTHRIERLQWFAAAYGLALVATIVIFTFMPAVGAFVYFDITPEQYATLPPDIYTPAKTLDALRSGAMKTVSLSNLEGLIAFPSFHTAAALLYAWALWPIKSLRWIVVPLNAAMIGTTPIGGAHYLIDVIAGFGVAAGSVGASRMFIQVCPTLSVAPALPSTA